MITELSINKIIFLIFYFIILTSTAALAESTNQKEYRLEGYVYTTYKCPPCPPEHRCKPCPKAHLIIVDSTDWADTFPSNLNPVVVLTDETDKFAVKDKCSLLVKPTKQRSNLVVTGKSGPAPIVDLVKIESITH